MRIRDLTEGFRDGWKASANAPFIGKGAMGNLGDLLRNKPSASGSNKSASQPKIQKSPFDQLSTKEAKAILHNILNGIELDSTQTAKLTQIYRKL